MDPTNIALWVILLALVALVPCGCIMTRHSRGKPRADGQLPGALH